MTLSLRILKLMADGKPRSVDEIAGDLQAPITKVKNSILWLSRSHKLNAVFKYEMTPAGFERSKFEPKPLAEIRQDAERKRDQRAHWGKQHRRSTNAVVESALGSQPALAQVWGVRA